MLEGSESVEQLLISMSFGKEESYDSAHILISDMRTCSQKTSTDGEPQKSGLVFLLRGIEGRLLTLLSTKESFANEGRALLHTTVYVVA